MRPAILNDLTRCIGCEACVWACKEVNELPRQPRPDRLTSDALSVVERQGDMFVRRQCMHCLDPACGDGGLLLALAQTLPVKSRKKTRPVWF